jgi:hypothetical protein
MATANSTAMSLYRAQKRQGLLRARSEMLANHCQALYWLKKNAIETAQAAKAGTSIPDFDPYQVALLNPDLLTQSVREVLPSDPESDSEQ